MKKFLSLMLTLALIITTLALPITASAADISLQSLVTGKTITVSFDPSTNTVHPGDTFTMTVKATPSEDITLDSYVVDIKYDGLQFTLNNEETDALKKFNADTADAYVRLISLTKDQSFTTNGLTLAALAFTVKDSATPKAYTTSVLGDDTEFTVRSNKTIDTFYGDTIVSTGATTTIEANSYVVNIDGSAIVNGKTYYNPSGVTVSVSGTGIEYVKINDGTSDETLSADNNYTREVKTAGTYTVKVKVKGTAEETKTFTLNTDNISAQLNTELSNASETGYKQGDTFEVPVKISGLASAQAALVSFKVTTDSGLTLDTTTLGEKVKFENETVIYGDTNSEVGLANEATVATLKFNVNTDATYGVKSVKIEGAKLALAKNAIDPTEDNIGIGTPEQKVVVVPGDKFANLPENITTQAWKNSSYEVAVTTVDEAISVKYLAVGELTTVETDTQAGLKAIYDNEQAKSGSTVTIDTENGYVIVARVGDNTNAVYQLVDTLLPGVKAWYDATNPNVDIKEMGALTGVQDAKDGYSLNVSKLKKEDKLSGIDKVQYKLGDGTYTDFDKDATAISLSAQNFNGNVTFKVIDKAGNEIESSPFALKLDMDDPTVRDMQVSEVKVDGTKDITATVNDVGSTVTGEAITVKAYKQTISTEDQAALDSISAIEALGNAADVTLDVDGKATYNTNEAGRYYFVAQDAAGHNAFASIDVSFETLSAASGIKVKIYDGATDYIDGFMTTNDLKLANFEGANGSFVYVNIKVNDPVSDKYKNTVTLKKDNNEAAPYVNETPITDSGDYELTVTTTHSVNSSDTQSATYKFTIVEAADMPSPNADKRFSITDYSMDRLLVENNIALPTNEYGFSGGIFSGDVTGDLKVNNDDLADIIRSIRAGEKKGSYTFNVLKKQAPVNDNE